MPRAGAIRRAVRSTCRRVARSARGLFPYPTGWEGARGLRYDADLLESAPRPVLARFVGVGNLLRVRAKR